MDDRKIRIEEKKLALQKRGQNLSAVKFLFGVVLLGVLAIAFDVTSFFHSQNHDNRTFLAGHRVLLQEEDLSKRLENIEFLLKIGGNGIEYLLLLHDQTKADIEVAKRVEEQKKRAEERRIAELQQARAEEIQRAKEAEEQAQAAIEQARQEAEALRAATQKSYDRALQEAYPHTDFFELKRSGRLIP